MVVDWESAFSEGSWFSYLGRDSYDVLPAQNLLQLKNYLDEVHIRQCLLRPYAEHPNYPVVDPRTLLPSFEPDPYEYHDLPGFSMLVFDRPATPVQEIFQYDFLHPVTSVEGVAGPCCPLESHILQGNLQTLQSRLPRQNHEEFRKEFQRTDVTLLEEYPKALPYLLKMDRAHVLSKDSSDHYHLSGIFASFPSDIDGEMKRFGIRIGKFKVGDNALYERNRAFVMQFLMELYGFPIASERRTSAALFARRLHKIGERFLIRVLGQSDRVITTIWNDGSAGRYPHVEKLALIRIDHEQHEVLQALHEAKAFVDEEQRVAIIRVSYRPHRFSIDNVRQDRALSVASQEVIHPRTGCGIFGMNIMKDSTNLLLRLNDIAKGEFYGRVVFKRTEVVENTDTDEKRLKFMYAWLTKHQRRIVGYSEEFFAQVQKILGKYLEGLEHIEPGDALSDLILEVRQRFSYIQQARTVRVLEDLRWRLFKGQKIGYERMLTEAVDLLHHYKFEISAYFDELVLSAIHHAEGILNDRYLRKSYIERPENELTKGGQEVRRKYGKLVQLADEFRAIYKLHQSGK